MEEWQLPFTRSREGAEKHKALFLILSAGLRVSA